jgi:hypothetical protein
MEVGSHNACSINTSGIIPFICEHWDGKPLFIIKGGIRGSMFPTAYGKAYFYEDFPWPDAELKPSKEACVEIARANDRLDPLLWVTKELETQFKALSARQHGDC